MVTHSLRVRMAFVVAIMAIPTLLFAGSVGKATGWGDSIRWDLSISGHDSIVLTVSHDGEVYSKTFKAGKPVVFSLRDMPDDAVLDGAYTYQLQVIPAIPPGVQKKLAASRAASDEKAAAKILREAGISIPETQTGAFLVVGGSIVDTNSTEGSGGSNARVGAPATDDTPASDTTSTAGVSPARRFEPRVNDQVIPDDLIVQGSGCFGFDCVNNESFGFDTIKMKENNLRIKAEDTSVGSFPTIDWQLTFNDSASGGASKFSVEDITGAKVPLTITAGAATNSLFVDSTGRIGFRTSTPVLDLHVATSNTPALRLEQNNAGGFTAQTWDIAGNEANFFVRDVTSGSRLPFRIRPGAPTSSIDIAADGDVGIGTASPAKRLHVVDTAAPSIGATQASIQGGDAGFGAGLEYGSVLSGGAYKAMAKVVADADNSWNTTVTTQDGRLGFSVATDGVLTERLRVSSTGVVTVTGDLTVTGVKNFATPDPVDPKNRSLYYVALEGPEAGTYFRGTARTVGGEAVISLPGYFSRITECERMTVQVTSIGKPGQPYVAEKTPEKLVIRVAEGAEDVEFDYFVQGVRRGYLNYEVERKNDLK